MDNRAERVEHALRNEKQCSFCHRWSTDVMIAVLSRKLACKKCWDNGLKHTDVLADESGAELQFTVSLALDMGALQLQDVLTDFANGRNYYIHLTST